MGSGTISVRDFNALLLIMVTETNTETDSMNNGVNHQNYRIFNQKIKDYTLSSSVNKHPLDKLYNNPKIKSQQM